MSFPAFAVGTEFIVIIIVVVSEPVTLLAIKVTVYVPAVPQQTLPGFCKADVPGNPPLKVHTHDDGELVLLSEKLMHSPTHADVDEEVICAVGIPQGFTVIVMMSVPVQPFASVTVSVYVVVEVGFATGL